MRMNTFTSVFFTGLLCALCIGCFSSSQEEADVVYELNNTLVGTWSLDSLFSDSLWSLESSYLFSKNGEFNNPSGYSFYTWKTFEDSILILEYEIGQQGIASKSERGYFRYFLDASDTLQLFQYDWWSADSGHGEIIASGRYVKEKK